MERKNINKKGFTLIELLAVIVILAIITVLATRTLLPLFSDAGKDGFAINANEVRNVSADLMSLYTFKKDELSADLQSGVANGCVCISELKADGLLEISDEYYGKVEIESKNNGYTYKLTMSNEKNSIGKDGGVSTTVTKDNVSDTKIDSISCSRGTNTINCKPAKTSE